MIRNTVAYAPRRAAFVGQMNIHHINDPVCQPKTREKGAEKGLYTLHRRQPRLQCNKGCYQVYVATLEEVAAHLRTGHFKVRVTGGAVIKKNSLIMPEQILIDGRPAFVPAKGRHRRA